MIWRYYLSMNDIDEPSTDNPQQSEVFPTWIKLRRIDRARNMCRFYLLTVQRDLFGGATLVREWGRVGSSGKLLYTHHPDEGAAIDALAGIAQQKFKRGYRL